MRIDPPEILKEADYQAEIKKKGQERSRIPTTCRAVRFERLHFP
jgi:hypothetical protein